MFYSIFWSDFSEGIGMIKFFLCKLKKVNLSNFLENRSLPHFLLEKTPRKERPLL